MNSNRSVPYNSEAEIYVLGSAFIDNRLISGYIGKLTENDFFDERNKLIYRAMCNLFNHIELFFFYDLQMVYKWI